MRTVSIRVAYDDPRPGAAEPDPAGGPDVVVVIAGCADAAHVAQLCASVAAVLTRGHTAVVTCDVTHLDGPAGSVVELLARLQLTARRCGGTIRLRHATRELLWLIALAGLDGALAEAEMSGGQPGRQAEQGEERSADVGVDPGDPAV